MNDQDANDNERQGNGGDVTANSTERSNSSTARPRSKSARSGKGAATAAKGKGKKTVTKNEELAPPKLTGKFSTLKPTIASQPTKLQWTMFTKTKNMLGLMEEIHEKSDGAARYGGNYFDKLNLDSDGKPKEKPYVPISLRMKPLLNCSKMIRNDARVSDIMAEVTTQLEIGNKTIMDEMKTKLSVHAKNIAELEVKARKHILAIEYFDAAMEIAGSLVIISKRASSTGTTKNKTEDLAYAAMHAALGLMDEEHVRNLPFADCTETNFTEGLEAGKSRLWEGLQKQLKFSWDDNIKPRQLQGDDEIINDVGIELAAIMAALTTKFWDSHKKKKIEAALDAELEEFLGRKEIITANQQLSDAMDVDPEEAFESVMQKKVDEKFRRKEAQEKSRARKKSSGGAKAKASQPIANGQSGKQKAKEKLQKGRGRSKRRSDKYSSENDDDDSYEREERDRRKSRRRDYNSKSSSDNEITPPKLILKKKKNEKARKARSVSFEP